MYWSGHLAIDPSHMTMIRRKPTRGFRRFAEILTAGLLAEREEQETFTAVTILQELNSVLRSLGITDLVRFSKDDEVVYEDQESRDNDDMRLLMERVEDRSQPLGTSPFQSLSLLLEHHLSQLALVIEVRIVRTHSIGFFPIQITVNGLAAGFAANGNHEQLESKLEETFVEQGAYERTTNELRQEFESFMNQLELAIRQRMHVNDLHKNTRTKIIRPREHNNTPEMAGAATGRRTSQDPVFDRYDSGADAFAYCWMWSSLLHSHGLQVHDTTVVDEAGQTMFQIDANGIDAGASSLLDPDVPLAQAEISSWEGIQTVDPDLSKSWGMGDVGDGSSTGGGWLSDIGSGHGDTGGADAGGAGSCGAASCGGSGCGGGGCGGGCGS